MFFKAIVYAGLMILVLILSSMKFERKTTIKKRKEQSKKLNSRNIVMDQVNSYVEKKVSLSKRHKIEQLSLQAGYKMDYAEYLILSLTSAIVAGLVVGLSLKNPFLLFVVAIIGYQIPYQTLTFVRNRRVALLEKQIGPFLNMSTERYRNSKDMASALELTLVEFKGEQPIYSELEQTVNEISLGVNVADALDNMAKRTGNRFLVRFAKYYRIASKTGTQESINMVLSQAFRQFEDNRKSKMKLKKRIAAPKRDGYMVLAMIPLVAVFSISTNENYVNFMTNTPVGQIGTAVISAVFIIVFWFVNTKIGAPIE